MPSKQNAYVTLNLSVLLNEFYFRIFVSMLFYAFPNIQSFSLLFKSLPACFMPSCFDIWHMQLTNKKHD